MNTPRLILAIVVGWVLIFGTDFLIHGLLLKPDYEATKQLWRPEEQMSSYFLFMMLAQIICAATFSIIWALGFAGRGVGAGAAFGLLMGIFQQVWVMVLYVILPMPGELAAKWYVSGLAQAILLGMVVAAIYNPKATALA